MKLKPVLSPWLLMLFLSCQSEKSVQETPTGAEKVWLMENGLAVIEIEAVKEGNISEGYWQKVPDSIQGYSGETALIWTGEGNSYKDPLVIDAPQTDGPYKLRYQVYIPEAGEYDLKIRNYHQHEDGDNDIWISLNGGIYQKLWDHEAQQWSWNEARANISTYQPVQLPAGINTIDMLGRSRGFIMDRMVIFKKGTPQETWSDLDLPQSALYLPEQEDHEPPVVPQPRVSQTAPTHIRLSWDPVQDNHQTHSYIIYQNQQEIDQSFDPEYLAGGLEPGNSYQFTVKAKDISGNLSEASAPIEVTTAFFPQDGITIGSTSDDLQIDGQPDDVGWNKAGWIPIDQEWSGTIANPEDLSARTKLLYDQQNLYLLVHVQDNQPLTTEDTYDGMAVYLDLDNNKTRHFSYDDRIYRFSLSVPKNEDGTFPNSVAKINRDEFIKGVKAARNISQNQYLYEIAIPWETLGTIPTAEKILGLNIHVQDYDESGKKEASLGLFGQSTQAIENPAGLGIVRLSSQSI